MRIFSSSITRDKSDLLGFLSMLSQSTIKWISSSIFLLSNEEIKIVTSLLMEDLKVEKNNQDWTHHITYFVSNRNQYHFDEIGRHTWSAKWSLSFVVVISLINGNKNAIGNCWKRNKNQTPLLIVVILFLRRNLLVLFRWFSRLCILHSQLMRHKTPNRNRRKKKDFGRKISHSFCWFYIFGAT